jgi:hypothetical protein
MKYILNIKREKIARIEGGEISRKTNRGDFVNLGQNFSSREIQIIKGWALCQTRLPRWDKEWKFVLKLIRITK